MGIHHPYWLGCNLMTLFTRWIKLLLRIKRQKGGNNKKIYIHSKKHEINLLNKPIKNCCTQELGYQPYRAISLLIWNFVGWGFTCQDKLSIFMTHVWTVIWIQITITCLKFVQSFPMVCHHLLNRISKDSHCFLSLSPTW